jgi:thymidine phosphorylase
MFLLGGASDEIQTAKKTATKLLDSGAALEHFRDMVRLQGGNPNVIEDRSILPRAQKRTSITADRNGYISSIQCEQIGKACVILGGGREKKEDTVDPSVGIELQKKLGDAVSAGESLCTIHYNSEQRASQAKLLISNSYQITDTPPPTLPPLIHRTIPSGAAN